MTTVDTRTPTTPAALLRPVRSRLILAMALEGLGTGCFVVMLIAVVAVGRRLYESPAAGFGNVVTSVVIAVVAYLVRVLLVASAVTVSHLADADFGVSLRRAIAQHLGRLPLGRFGTYSSGDVRKLAHDDVAALHVLVAHALLDMVSAVVLPVAVFVYLCTIDVGLTLVCLVPLIVGLVMHRVAMRGADRLLPQFYSALARINGAVVEFVKGISVVRTFGQTGRAHRSFREATEDYNDFFESWAKRTTNETCLAITALAAPVSLMVVAGFGYLWLQHGAIDPIDFAAFLLMGSALSSPVFPFIMNLQTLRNARVSQAAITRLLATPPLPVPAQPQPPTGGTVRFRDVTFGYAADRPVLHDIDLDLEPGTVTAVVGRSGSGKSTLAGLLPRFHDPDTGSISIGGTDLRDLAPADLYRQVAFVFQDVSLLRLSIEDNIRLGRPEAGREAVVAAARAAAIHDRIAVLPAGYDSVIGEDVVLSGGESQRVAIARALLADAPILVLDEAASYADPDSEAQVQQALTRLMRGRTILTIAHRLASVAGADQIVVLADGRIAERGRHPDLLAAGGTYAELWRTGQTLLSAGGPR